MIILEIYFMKMNIRYFILPLMSAIFLTSASCKSDFLSEDGFCWGTSYHIVYESASDLSDSIKAEIRYIDASLSTFNSSSRLSAVNESRTDSVDAMFAEVFRLSKRVSDLSGGAFDPTVAPLVKLWGFGPESEGRPDVPDSSLVTKVLGLVGIGDCRLDAEGMRVVKKSPDTSFDFSAIAKGYGVDRVASMLRRNGVHNYMVEIGGEIALQGYSPRGKRWRIQVDAPVVAEKPEALHSRFFVLELGPEPVAVAGSGNYRNRRTTSDGRVVWHTISPVTGYPVQRLGIYPEEYFKDVYNLIIAGQDEYQQMLDTGCQVHMIFAMDPTRANFSQPNPNRVGCQLESMRNIASRLFGDQLVWSGKTYAKDW